MSYLCYSLDEAAKQLDMSETVLFRLSQFLKVPANAYDDVGYIAFNGDLSFDDNDLSFFKQVKERLLKGETLEAIKQRLRHNPGHAIATTKAPSESGHSPTVNNEQEKTQEIKTIHTDSHLKKEADKNFHRYKTQTRPRLNQVFQNLANQITENLKPEKLKENFSLSKSGTKDAATEGLLGNLPSQPLWHPEAIQKEDSSQSENSSPWQTSNHYQTQEHTASQQQPAKSLAESAFPTEAETSLFDISTHQESGFNQIFTPEDINFSKQTESVDPWDEALFTASQQPRALNVRLRAAAQTLKQKALRQLQESRELNQ